MKNRIFSLLLAICLLLAVMPFSVAAEQIAVSGTTGDCVWTLDGTTLTISGSGAMADYDEPVEEMSDITIINWYNQPPWYDSDITEIIISEGVTHIGDYAFNSKDYSFEIWDYGDCPGCDTVIPDPIEEKPICDVCAGTFIPYVMGVQEYNSGLAVTSVTIPESVTDIGSNAFIGCDELLVKGYANSYAETFANENGFSFEDLSHICSYTSVTTAPTCSASGYITYICSDCGDTYTVTDETTPLKDHSYKKGVCENCGDIYTTTDFEYTVTNGKITITCYNGFDTLVEIPAYIDGYPVTVIGEQAFLMCSDITDIIIPYTVMTIEDDAFNACSSLSRIDLGNSVTSIGNLAFSGCSSLTSINLPATVSTLGNSIFAYCDNLTYITVAYGNTVFYSEGNCIIESATKTVVAACNKSVIPDYVTAIGKKAFYGCDVMTTVTIPHSVTIINDNAFYGCNQLTSVIFGSGLTRIGNNAFNRCTKLKNIYYCGDYSEWLDISKGSGNTTLSSAKFNSHRYTFSYYIGATCLSYGYSVQECVLCHNTNMIEDIDNGYADHTYEDDYTVDKEPTAFENGSKSRHCIYCSERTDITVIPANSKAHGTCGTGAMWALTEDGVLMISGNGATDDYKLPALAPWYQYAAEIVSLKIESSITRIGNNNFSCLSNLTNAEINNPDTEFGVYAFAKGINLTIHALGGGNVETYAKENGYTIKKPENAIIPLNVSIEQISGYNVTLKALSGYEYSLDGINWQSDNTFTGLLPATAYTFYQRIAEGVYSASVTSDGKTVTTLAISKAAVIESIIGNIATLTPISGYEYSIDGINWQTSNVFVIPMNRVICFYQRKPANGIYAASPASQAVKGITVSAPTVMVSGSAIYIKPVEGCEYGLENVLWQTENVFGEWIVPGESYTVYQRFVNTEGVFAVYDTNGTTVVINGNEFCSDPNATHLVDLRKLLLNSNSNDISADYNGDYTVDLRDLIRLKKHIAGEDVPLGSENGATAGYALYNETAYFEQKNNF